MSFKITIDPIRQESLRTKEVTFGISVYDKYDESILLFNKEDIPKDDLQLLELVVQSTDNVERHGSHTCGDVGVMLDLVKRYHSDITIGDTFLESEKIKEIMV